MESVITVTERARLKALAARAEEPDGGELALFLEVLGPMGTSYDYDLYFDRLTEAGPADLVQQEGDLPVVVPAASVDLLRGATLDVSRNLLAPGWVVDNPNSPSPAVGATHEMPELSGDTAERVAQVLDYVINPSIASHGGHAELVSVEDDVAYLRLSGGCQGCGMASVTLGQGIEVAIREAVPEIARVVDVTDHAAGSNPYFEPAKK
jgi:Fe/S biogenesis protein NfuA